MNYCWDNFHSELVGSWGVVYLYKIYSLVLKNMIHVLQFFQKLSFLLDILIIKEDGKVIMFLNQGLKKLFGNFLNMTSFRLLSHPHKYVDSVHFSGIDVWDSLIKIHQGWKRVNTIFSSLVIIINP